MAISRQAQVLPEEQEPLLARPEQHPPELLIPSPSVGLYTLLWTPGTSSYQMVGPSDDATGGFAVPPGIPVLCHCLDLRSLVCFAHVGRLVLGPQCC